MARSNTFNNGHAATGAGITKNTNSTSTTDPSKKKSPIRRPVPCPVHLTTFEQDAVLALLCRNLHQHPDGAEGFAAALGEALHPSTSGRDDDDPAAAQRRLTKNNKTRWRTSGIGPGHVEKLLAWLDKHHGSVMRFIEQQHGCVPTRPARRVFRRAMVVGRCGMADVKMSAAEVEVKAARETRRMQRELEREVRLATERERDQEDEDDYFA